MTRPKNPESTAKVVGNGFIQRTKKPTVQGGKVKSQLVRVDAGFAKWLRQQAKAHGSITEVTRRLNTKAAMLILAAMVAEDDK
jgi:hypothetical protein